MKRIYLWWPDSASFSEELARKAMVSLCAHAVGDSGQRIEGDPVFERVTEGRTKNAPTYSACGDLPHWAWRCLGVRNEKIVNRSDDGGAIPWAMGVNISRIVYSTGSAFVPTTELTAFKQAGWLGGDTLFVTSPEHVMVAAQEVRLAVGSVVVASFYEYGQFDKKLGKRSGALHDKLVRRPTISTITIANVDGTRERTLMGLVNLGRLLENEPGLESAIVPDDFEGGHPDDSPYTEVDKAGKALDL